MRKTLAVLLGAALAITLTACGNGGGSATPSGGGANGGKTIYVLGPTPDHGWTAQAGAYAQKKVDEINQAGQYKAQFIASSSGEAQNDVVQTIIANGDAAGVMFHALDDSAKSGQEALIAAGIPFISFDRIIMGPDQSAILNYSGDNWEVGSGVAYWLQQHGMKPGDTLVTLIGDNGTVSSRRQEGFEGFLEGSRQYSDKVTGQTYTTSQTWTADQVSALTADYKVVCNWSADTATQYFEQSLPDIITKAKANGGNLYVFSMDDEMTFGLLNLLQGNTLSDADKATLESMNLYISAVGGMQELYNVMEDKDTTLSPIADKYFDDMMSMYFSPQMVDTAIDYMVQYLNKDNWTFKTGDSAYEPTFVVDRSNASQNQGFTGH